MLVSHFTVYPTFPQAGSGASVSREDLPPPTTVVHSSLPLGGATSSHKQVSVTHVDVLTPLKDACV